jgi:hypothetical protein
VVDHPVDAPPVLRSILARIVHAAADPFAPRAASGQAGRGGNSRALNFFGDLVVARRTSSHPGFLLGAMLPDLSAAGSGAALTPPSRTST